MRDDRITFGYNSVSVLEIGQRDGYIFFDKFWFMFIEPYVPTLLAFIFLLAVCNAKIFQYVSNSFGKATNGPITELDFGLSLLHR